jgi:hypothetical protein
VRSHAGRASQNPRRTTRPLPGECLPQAAVLAEFAEDDETFKSLTVVAIKEPHRFDRVVQAERNSTTCRLSA